MRLFIDFFCCALVGLTLALHAHVSGTGSPTLVGGIAALSAAGAFVLRRRLMKRYAAFQEKRKKERAAATCVEAEPDTLPAPGAYRRYKLESAPEPG